MFLSFFAGGSSATVCVPCSAGSYYGPSGSACVIQLLIWYFVESSYEPSKSADESLLSDVMVPSPRNGMGFATMADGTLYVFGGSNFNAGERAVEARE